MRTIKKKFVVVVCVLFILGSSCLGQNTKNRFFTNQKLSFYYHIDLIPDYKIPLHNFEINYNLDFVKKFELATGFAYNTYFIYGDNEYGDEVKIYYKYLSFPLKVNFKANHFYVGPCIIFEFLLNNENISPDYLNTSKSFTIGLQAGYNIMINNRIFISPEFRYVNQIKSSIQENPNHREPFYIGTFYLRNAGLGLGIKYKLKK